MYSEWCRMTVRMWNAIALMSLAFHLRTMRHNISNHLITFQVRVNNKKILIAASTYLAINAYTAHTENPEKSWQIEIHGRKNV